MCLMMKIIIPAKNIYTHHHHYQDKMNKKKINVIYHQAVKEFKAHIISMRIFLIVELDLMVMLELRYK